MSHLISRIIRLFARKVLQLEPEFLGYEFFTLSRIATAKEFPLRRSV